uniref:Putative 5.3 kDa protein n=1 Tax=Ixodes ricinus TaxID=34613 RepID=A0A0K8R7Y2_IXORI
MRALTIFITTLLLMESFYVVESSQRDRGPKYKNPPFCRQLCDKPSHCGGACPNCPYSAWRSMECVN